MRCELLSTNNQLLDSDEEEILTIGDILLLNEESLEVRDNPITSVQISPHYVEEEYLERNDIVYNIKSIKISWENSINACLHVFSDITSLTQLEKQKANNKAMHMMFSSVSHELRTPLN